MATEGTSFEYEVALSFAGEDRTHAQEVAELLKAQGVKVFYDFDEQGNLWGKDLYVHLHEVYSQKARFCIIFVSKHYAAKRWTSHERQAAQARAFQEKGAEYILPIRIDETPLPGLPTTIGFLPITIGARRIAEAFVCKLGKNPAEEAQGSDEAESESASKTNWRVLGGGNSAPAVLESSTVTVVTGVASTGLLTNRETQHGPCRWTNRLQV